jgi:hypothetical protein
MGYYIRLLSPSDATPAYQQLKESLSSFESVSLMVEDGDEQDWKQLLLAHADETPITTIERNVVRSGEVGAEEIAEFLEEIEDCRPASAVAWLRDYFAEVKCIYAFQILSGTEKDDGWSAVYAIRGAIQEVAGGIMQADSEGFSNEEGFHILWQFSDTAKGPWWMAVRRDGEWVTFQIQLGNRKHREAFFRGEVPAGITAGRPGE